MIEAKNLAEVLEDAGREVFAYSGRSMYGDECIGFQVNEDETLVGVVAEVCLFADLDEVPAHEIHDAFNGARVDQLGKGTVVYFPRVTVESGWKSGGG